MRDELTMKEKEVEDLKAELLRSNKERERQLQLLKMKVQYNTPLFFMKLS